MTDRTGKITAISAQKRNMDRVNIFIEHEFAFGLALNAATGLFIGKVLDAGDVARLKRDDEYEKVKERVIDMIANRPRSKHELRLHFRRKDIDEELGEAVIARLEEVQLLDDASFARYWVEQRNSFKPRSRYALSMELRQKGIDSAIIDEVLSEHEDDQAAFTAAQQRSYRWQHLPYDQFKEKLGRFLRNRGFSYTASKEAIDSIWDTIQAENNENET